MVKCPYCGSEKVTSYKTPEGERGHYCYDCKREFKTVGDKVLTGIFKKKKKKEGEEEEGKKKEAKHSIIPGLLLLVALIITFLVPLDHLTKTFVVIGMAIFVIFVYGLFNLASFGFIVLVIYLVFNLPTVSAELERIGFYEGIKTLKNEFCINTCILRNVFYTRADPRTYCESECGVIQINKIPGACTECLTYEKYERIYPAREDATEIVDINLKMAKSNTIAENVWVEVFREKDEVPASISKCTKENSCELRSEDEKRVIATFNEDDVKCDGSAFKYKIRVNYDFETKSDNSFDLVKEITGTVTEVKSPSSEGPLSVSIGGQKAYVIGEEDVAYISIYVVNNGKGTVYIKDIEFYQIPPYGEEELSFMDCTKGFIFRNADYSYSDKTLSISGDIKALGKNEKDAMICKFSLPPDIPSSKLTYSFKAVVSYSYQLENSYSIPCRKET
jgi:hypothetical protein